MSFTSVALGTLCALPCIEYFHLVTSLIAEGVFLRVRMVDDAKLLMI